MIIDEKLKKIIIKENDIEKEYEIIAFIKEEVGEFIVYTENHKYGNGNIELLINKVVTEKDELMLVSPTNEELKLVIEELQKRMDE